MATFPHITAITLTPLLGGLIVLSLPGRSPRIAKGLALGIALLSLGMAAGLWAGFDPLNTRLQFVEQHEWIPTLNVQYFLGVDGLGLLMVMLAALLVPMAMLVSWKLEDRPRLYFGLMLLLQAGLFGTFTALNFFHWFLFWELSLIPAFFLIRLWGGAGRGPAATQFFVYTMAGSVAMLLSFLAIWRATGTFDFTRLAELGASGQLKGLLAAKLGWHALTASQVSLVIFGGVLLGFAVKVPLMPFHTWLPPAYSEAPSSTTILLTGAMSKMGVYGFLRILLPVFPGETRMLLTPLLWLAVATVVISAFAAFAQRDIKRMLAYSSVNHLGYCLLGLFAAMKATPATANDAAAAVDGVMLQMFNHGITAGVLFAFVALLEQRSGGLRGLDDFGGLRKPAPVFAGLMGIAIFASLGLPGLNGFVGEFLIFKGVFALTGWAAVLSAAGLLVTAVFLLTLIQRVFAGPLNARWNAFPDLTTGERLMVLPAIALMFLIGLWPQCVLGMINETVIQLVERWRLP